MTDTVPARGQHLSDSLGCLSLLPTRKESNKKAVHFLLTEVSKKYRASYVMNRPKIIHSPLLRKAATGALHPVIESCAPTASGVPKGEELASVPMAAMFRTGREGAWQTPTEAILHWTLTTPFN